MIQMSKEWLEKISKNATGIMNMDSGTVDSIDLPIIDFTRLIQFAKEQSERLQELETDYVILGVEQEEEIMSELESLKQQNKRYREALENIRTVKYDDEFNPYAYMMLEIIEWAEEALEVNSDDKN